MLGFDLKVDISGLQRKMQIAEAKLIPFIKTTGMQLADWGFQEIKSRTPGDSLKQSWRMSHTTKGMQEVFRIYSIYPRQEVVAFMEEGTRPHVIRPIRARCLHFFLEGSGLEIFTMSVFHRGIKPYKMVESVKDDLEDKIALWQELVYREKERLMAEGVR